MNANTIPNAQTTGSGAHTENPADAILDAGGSPSAVLASSLVELQTDAKGNIVLSRDELKAMMAELIATSNQTTLGQVKAVQAALAAKEREIASLRFYETEIGGFGKTRPTENDVVIETPKEGRHTMHVPVILNSAPRLSDPYAVRVFNDRNPALAPVGMKAKKRIAGVDTLVDVAGRQLYTNRRNVVVGVTTINQSLQTITLLDRNGKAQQHTFTVRCTVQAGVSYERVPLSTPFIDAQGRVIAFEDRPIALDPDEVAEKIDRQDSRERGPGDGSDTTTDGDPNPTPNN